MECVGAILESKGYEAVYLCFWMNSVAFVDRVFYYMNGSTFSNIFPLMA